MSQLPFAPPVASVYSIIHLPTAILSYGSNIAILHPPWIRHLSGRPPLPPSVTSTRAPSSRPSAIMSARVTADQSIMVMVAAAVAAVNKRHPRRLKAHHRAKHRPRLLLDRSSQWPFKGWRSWRCQQGACVAASPSPSVRRTHMGRFTAGA